MTKKNLKALNFIKRNAVYFILALCLLAIGLSLTFAVIKGNNAKIESGNNQNQEVPDIPVVDPTPEVPDTPVDDIIPDTPSEPVDTKISFIMPVDQVVSISEYTTTMVFNSTLDRYQVHNAIDFYAQEGTPVYAVYDGTIESVTNDLLKGVTVTIDHGNGLKTVYNSLADGETVIVGQTVKQGDIIGEVSVTNRQEYGEGAHLHFQVLENGQVIDPAKYLTLDEK
jgi:murein DD-endopeptidase MepM/ murein hydrolase activator NlpD